MDHAETRRLVRFTAKPSLLDQDTEANILETGIKVIDLICPFIKGGKVGIRWAGVGKTVVIMELINNIAKALAAIPFLLGWGATGRKRPLPGNVRSRVINQDDISKSKVALVYGQMNEPPGARMRVALSGLSMAEYFRDEMGQDVWLFVDNIFRFSQAGSEVSALLVDHLQQLAINQPYLKKWVFCRNASHPPKGINYAIPSSLCSCR